MKFRDMELDFDLFDAETAEAYEEAVKQVQQVSANRPKDEMLSATIRRQCGQIFDFFDDLFGEGFHRQLFGERTNLTECVDVFAEFAGEVDAQKGQLEDKISKYAPNRATRRATTVAGKR